MVQKQLRIRMPDGTWHVVGIPSNPIKLRMPDNTWKIFGGGGGQELNVRDNQMHQWVQVSSSGLISGIITGLFYEFNPAFTVYTPLKNKTIRIYSYSNRTYYTTKTNSKGIFKFTNVPIGQVSISGLKDNIYSYVSVTVNITSDDPIKYVELGTPETRQTYTYAINDVFSGAKRFLWSTGWTANTRQVFEWRNNPDGEIGTEQVTNESSGLYSQVYSTTGWTGGVGAGDYGIDYRYRDETVSWYSVPVGIFLDDARTQFTIEKINNPTGWTANAFIESIEIVHNLQGYSLQKSQVPWMAHYGFADTTLGYYPGVGQLLYQGHTIDNGSNLVTGSWGTGVYTIPTVRNRIFARESGTALWTGNLNDLGWTSGSNGIPYKAAVQVKQTLLESEITDVSTSLQYQMQVSDLPDPISFSDADSRVNQSFTLHNYAVDSITVNIVYRWS